MQKKRTAPEIPNTIAIDTGDLAASAADLIGDAFVRYHAEFKAITERAHGLFEVS
jgi:hypothetical protein